MRQSAAIPRASSAVQGAALSKLIEKKKEYDAVSALERASALYLERIEALGEEFNIMANAGEVHGQVLAQWPKMFQILNEFLSSRDSFQHVGEADEHRTVCTEGQRLIRVPIEELQETKSHNLGACASVETSDA